MASKRRPAPPRIEIRDLRLLLAVAAEGSLTGAGRRLHLTQPALSRHLASLERRAAGPLFHRTGNRMVPTAAGDLLLRHARELVDRIERAEAELGESTGVVRRTIRVGTECYTGLQWLPSVSRRFAARHPGIEVDIALEATRRPAELLRKGRIDVALLTDCRPLRGLSVSRLLTDELVAVVAPGHPWSARPFVEPADFAAVRLLLLTPPAESTVVQRFLDPARVRPRQVADVQLVGALAALVEGEFGVGVLPAWAVGEEVRTGRLVPVRLGRRGLQRTWSAAVVKSRSREPWVEDFVAAVAADAGGRGLMPAGD